MVATGLSFIFLARRYLQLHDPECLTSSSTPVEHAACFMAHALGYDVLSLAHTASSARLSGHVSLLQSAHRPRPSRSSQRHFFPPLHWISSHDFASEKQKKKWNRIRFIQMTTGLTRIAKTENRCFVLDLHHMRQMGRACLLFNSAREVEVAQKNELHSICNKRERLMWPTSASN